jgi:hypothetical protein
LTPEQTIIWLDGMRELMLEVWSKNPRQIPSDKQRIFRPDKEDE